MIQERLRPYFNIIVPVGVAAAGFIVAKLVTVDVVGGVPPPWRSDIAAVEAGARWWVATATLLLLAAVVGAVAGAWHILTSGVRTIPKRTEAIHAFAVMAVLGGIAVGIFVSPAYSDLGRKLFEHSVGTYPNAQGTAASLVGVSALAKIADVATLVAAAAIAAVAGALIAPPPPQAAGTPPQVSRDEVEGQARVVASMIRNLKLLLFLAAAVLVASLLQTQAWASWPATYWTDEKVLAPLKSSVQATVSFRTALYVAVLAAIFLSAAVRLREAGRQLAQRHSGLADEAARQRWLSDTGLALSIGEQAKRVIAIVSPFLTAAAVTWFDKIIGLPIALSGVSAG